VPHIDLDTLDVNDSSSFTKPLSNLVTPTSYNDSFVQGDSVQDTLAGESVNEEYILETDAEFEQMHVFNGVNGSFFGSSSTYKYVSVSTSFLTKTIPPYVFYPRTQSK